MRAGRELLAFLLALAALIAALLPETLFGGRILSPSDVLFVSATFRGRGGPAYEPANRLLMDPALQFEPWLAFSRAMLRRGRLPLWNDRAGCGVPHLANGQSAVFDPFHGIAYLGPLPESHARMAAARLFAAGLGMFLLARAWGLGSWGRWFAGLAYPVCGFMAAWLLFPSASTAVWFPWVMLATSATSGRPSGRSCGGLGLATGLMLLGGQVQVAAHVMMASAAYAATRGRGAGVRGVAAWAIGVGMGVGVGAIQVVPLAVYLTRSPAWADRDAERPSPWTFSRPRFLDAACTALPYLYGSQRREHPNLARALGVHNLNESAGGFAGLVTLAVLAPLAVRARRGDPTVRYLAGLVIVGGLGAFGVAPVANLLRAMPIVNVIDPRRLTLWVAFGLILLGGIGLDAMVELGRGRVSRRWPILWGVAACACLAAAVGVAASGGRLRERARAHYGRSAALDSAGARARADRQADLALRFLPAYLGMAGLQLGLVAAGAVRYGRGRVDIRFARAGLFAMALGDLFGFARGLNPAMPPWDYLPESPVIDHLRREVGGRGRIVGVGAELIPNTLMRFGLADVRDYDSIELARAWEWFAPLYEPSREARSSRRAVTWEGVRRASGRLAEAGVLAVVGASPPPEGLFPRVDRVGGVWIGRPAARPLVGGGVASATFDSGRVDVELLPGPGRRVIVRQMAEPGWVATVDGRPAAVGRHRGTFLAVEVPAGAVRLALRYEPAEVRAGLMASFFATIGVGLALTRFRGLGSTGFRRRAWIAPKSRGRIGPAMSRRPRRSSPIDEANMVHFTCDLCGKNLPASGQPRYVVKIEAYAGFDPNQITEEDLDEDHMEAIAELLQAEEVGDIEAAPVRQAYRFDLCPCCHARYTKDPLGRDLARSFDFSKN